MNMRSQLGERLRSACRWLIPVALLAVTPKCFLCVTAYLGLGAVLGLGGPEICGAAGTGLPSVTALSVPWVPLSGALVLAWRTRLLMAGALPARRLGVQPFPRPRRTSPSPPRAG